jgi:SAM-dependent methyltransferase
VRRQIRKDINSFSNQIGRQNTILDLGSGVHCKYKDQFDFHHYFGVDLFDPSDVQGDLLSTPFKDDAANLVICSEVLEHLEDPIKALKEIHRVLISGSYLIVTVPLVWGVHDHVDYQRWTERALRKHLASTGFRIIELRKRGGIFSLIGSIITQIPAVILGEYRTKRNLFSKGLHQLFIGITMAIAWFLSPFDRFDSEKNWVIGYSVLCQKK